MSPSFKYGLNCFSWVEKIADHGTNGSRNCFRSPESKKCENKGGTEDLILRENPKCSPCIPY